MYAPPRYAPPPTYIPYEYTTTPMSAPAYANAKYAYTATPPKPKGHTRRPTAYTNGAPPTSYHPPPYSSGYYTTSVHTPPKQDQFVSSKDKMRPNVRGSTGKDDVKRRRAASASKQPNVKYTTTTYTNTKPAQVYDAFVEDDEGYYSPSKDHSPPPPYHQPSSYYRDGYLVTDHYSYGQVPTTGHKQAAADPPKYKSASRTRSNSHSYTTRPHQQQATAKTSPSKSTPQRARANSNVKSPPKASAADAARVGIPAGYSYKNWDPTEEPILLLGSVFDANSLGKWIYDWTVHYHGAATPMADLAGELWLLLIQLAGKIKRAEECLPRIRYQDDSDLVDEFLQSGERLWSRFNKILKTCEDHMWRVAKKESSRSSSSKKASGSGSAAPSMGAKSGCEFVDSIFGRDRKLEDTEKLMTSMRLWSMRFDANCEDILRHPSG